MNFDDIGKKFIKLGSYLCHGDFNLIPNVFEDFPHLKYFDNDNVSMESYILMIKGITGCIACTNTQKNGL
jgi:hypothetical protein